MKNKKILFIACLLFGLLMVPVAAQDVIPDVNVGPQATEQTSNPVVLPTEVVKDKWGIQTDLLPNVSLEEAGALIQGKAAEAITLFRSVLIYCLYGVFAALAIGTVLGMLGIGPIRGLFQGVLGMTICGLVYIAIRYGPEILQAFENWVFATPL